MLVLSIIQGPDKGRKFRLPDHEPQLIGRSTEAIPMSDNTISRRHAELTPDGGLWYIRDLQSQNGTWVNGTRITERSRLRPGDQVRTGATLMVFGIADENDPEVVSIVRPDQMDTSIERAMSSSEDSVVLSEPEPKAAAADHLRIIYQLTTLTTQTTDRNALLKSTLDLIFAEFKPQRGFVLLVIGSDKGPGDPQLRPAAVKYASQQVAVDDAKIVVSKTIINHVMKRHEGVLSTNAMVDPRFASGDSVHQMNIRSAICTPIRFRDRTFGVIYIDSTTLNYTFTSEQLSLLNAIGQHTGLALANAELYAQKLQSERLAAVGETVASLSHSIKNILQGLRGGADVVELGLKKDDLKIARGGWTILKRNLDRIMSLTLNMLAFSRQRRVEPELTKLGPLIEECAQLLEGQAAARQVAVIVDVDPEMPPIPIDPSLVHQSLMNLMTNAVEAVSPETGAVTIKAVYHTAKAASGEKPQTPAFAEISVIDNGPGIPEDRLPWLFEPFNSTKGLRGTGLGLAVTRRIVEEHGGRILVDPRNGQSRGRGATFKILFPAEATAIDPSKTAASKVNPGDPSRL